MKSIIIDDQKYFIKMLCILPEEARNCHDKDLFQTDFLSSFFIRTFWKQKFYLCWKTSINLSYVSYVDEHCVIKLEGNLYISKNKLNLIFNLNYITMKYGIITRYSISDITLYSYTPECIYNLTSCRLSIQL